MSGTMDWSIEQDAVNGEEYVAVSAPGPQQIVPAALLGGSVNVNTLAFLTEVPGARRLSVG
jgi:uncharacterized protein (AIM24 family)